MSGRDADGSPQVPPGSGQARANGITTEREAHIGVLEGIGMVERSGHMGFSSLLVIPSPAG